MIFTRCNEDKMISYIDNNKYDKVKHCVHKGFLLDRTYYWKRTPDLKMARLLLELGYNPNLQDTSGNMSLHHVYHNSQLVSLLLDAGADPNILNRYGRNALLELCHFYQQNDWDRSSHHTTRKNIFSLLLDAGADPNIQDIDGYTALNYLCEIKEDDVSELVSLLLETGADPNIQNNLGNTALMMACIQNHSEIVSLLLEAGADPNIQNNGGKTALMMACIQNHSEIVSLLLEAGADPNIQNNVGKTALFYASIYITNQLLDYGADLEKEIERQFGYHLSREQEKQKTIEVSLNRLLKKSSIGDPSVKNTIQSFLPFKSPSKYRK